MDPRLVRLFPRWILASVRTSRSVVTAGQRRGWQFLSGRGRRAVWALASCAFASAFRSSSQDEPDAVLSPQLKLAVSPCCLPRLPSGSKAGQPGPAPMCGCSPVPLACLCMSSSFINPSRAQFELSSVAFLDYYFGFFIGK